MSNALGIDVSHYQGTVDWNAVKAAGNSFAFIKATEGDAYKDPQFDTNWQGAKAAGLIRGVYHYFHPSVDAVAQAQFFVNTLGTLDPGDKLLVLNLEILGMTAADLALDNASWVANTASCLTEIEQLTGRVPIIFTPASSADVWKTKMAVPDAPAWTNKYTLWVANYPVTQPEILKGWAAWTFWQYSVTGQVNGITGNVDLNQFNGTAVDLMNWVNPPSGGPWLLQFTNLSLTSNPTGDGRPWGDGTAMAARAAAGKDPWDTNCKVEPLIGGFAAMTSIRDALLDAIAKAKAKGVPGDDLGHVYISDYRLNPLRDLSTDNPWDPSVGWISSGSDTISDETAVGLILKLMQAGIIVRILAWMPTRWERDRGHYVPHCLEHFWLSDLIAEESVRLKKQYTALQAKAPIGLIALDARVGPGVEAGSHHQKFLVIRGPGIDVAFVGGVDLAFTRRDAANPSKGFNPAQAPAFFAGDWQSGNNIPHLRDGWPHDAKTTYDSVNKVSNPQNPNDPSSDLPVNIYGDSLQRWHDQHLRLEGQIVKTVEEHFAERWRRAGPIYQARDAVTRRPNRWNWGDVLLSEWTREPTDPMPDVPIGPDITSNPGTSTVQLWRTVPLPLIPDNDRQKTAPLQDSVLSRGEFTVLAGMTNALLQANELIWVFDQYFWSLAFARLANKQMLAKSDLCMIVILPPFSDDAQVRDMQHGRRRLALEALTENVPDRANRVGVYDLWDKVDRNEGIYVHAKAHTYDGDLLIVGSANVNRRSLLGDSEMVCAVADRDIVASHQNNLWTLLFANTLTPKFPSLDLSVSGSGRSFFSQFDTAARRLQSFLIPDPWEDHPAMLPGPVERQDDPNGGSYSDSVGDSIWARVDYSCVSDRVEKDDADLNLIYHRLERMSGIPKHPWPFRSPAS